MGDAPPPSGVLLVGSIPLSSPEEVFKKACSALPGKLRSIPDGETGIRDSYITWQNNRFPAETQHFPPFGSGVEMPANHPGITLDSFGSTGYCEAACNSYQKFADLQKQGVIPPGVRFQVSLPIPYDCIQIFLREEYHAELGPHYEQRMRESVTRILETIPAEDLAIQWDIALLAPLLEVQKGRESTFPGPQFCRPQTDPKGIWIGNLVPFCDMIPAEVSLGLHLCYGDRDHRHVVEPEDTAILKDLAQTMVTAISRPVQWVHMPVPKERDDVAYFEPLKNLDIGKAALFLGLVHGDDEEGTRKRIAAAQAAGVYDFGVATECGLGRTPLEQLEGIFSISHSVTAPVDSL